MFVIFQHILILFVAWRHVWTSRYHYDKKRTAFAVLSTEEKHQSRKRGWINLPVASKFHFSEEIYYIWYTIWATSLIRIKTGYDGGYFLLMSKLQKYCVIIFIRKIIWKMFMGIFYVFFHSFSYRGKITIKGVSNIIGSRYSITIIKEEYSWYIRCYSF